MDNDIRQVSFLMRDGRYAAALELQKEMVKKYPRNPMAWELYAMVHRIVGDHDGADKSLEYALKLSPDSAKLHYDKGYNYIQMLKFPAAKAFRHSITIPGTRAEAHYSLAVCLERQGNFVAHQIL